MKALLLDAAVTSLERAVLLDMAAAVKDGSTVYSWGHDRLAEAIGKRPGSQAAKSALSVRIIPSLITKGMIRKQSAAHRSHRAEYDLSILSRPVDNSTMGTGAQSGMGTGFESEWVPVSGGMGIAQTGTPPPDTTKAAPRARASASTTLARTCPVHPNWDHDDPCRRCGNDRRAFEAHAIERRPATMSEPTTPCTDGHAFVATSGYCGRCGVRDDRAAA
ncbi:hypothetical protein [Microbacterium sp. C7(2022)]|uniref:hypothetical protein n=1 Tax=Microbacterium sp. C7(2022) TaxID=2992759 RepID=UPI00237A769A|nr:hypothetical protein [Microbacterium sp. C7(2022)]